MKKLKIAYVDFWKGMNPETHRFTQILRKHYEVEITNKEPDFVFCSTFGHQFLEYSCPRILYVGEAFCPDFNLYDYAIGFDHIQFEDRYLRYPFCLMQEENVEQALAKQNRTEQDFLKREKFCGVVVSSGGGVDDIRNWYFDKISEYKKVDSGGRFRNNLPDGKPVADKKSFLEQYRFSLAFENTSFPGYVTEKIIDAWAAGTIPIYYGDPYITKEFNEKAFVLCRGREDYNEVMKRVCYLDENREAYLQMAKEPIILPESPIWNMLKESYLEDFLLPIFDQDPQKAIRRNAKLTMWGKLYEYQVEKWDKIEHFPMIEWAKKWKRKLFGLKKVD